jgi:hypothetical protein
METSRVNLAALAVALVGGLLVLHLPESQGMLASLAGIALLVALFAFGQDGARTGLQSLAFALVAGLAALATFSFPLRIVVGGGKAVFGEDVIPPVFWLLASAIFWFVDRSAAEPSGPQPVTFGGGYSQPQTLAYAAPPQTFTPAPVVMAEPETVVAQRTHAFTPAPVSGPGPEAAIATPPPPPAPVAPATGSTAAAVPPPLTGKEVSIYVNMVGEGMNVLRSVRAEHLGRDFYIIVDEMPADENWEFVPGQVVRCKKKNLSNGKGMVAYEEAPRAQ